MAWYLNRYVCPECSCVWEDAWSAMSDDYCPECECSDISPVSSENLSVIIEKLECGDFVVLVSHDDAHDRLTCPLPVLHS